MISGTIVDNFGFVAVDKKGIVEVQLLRRKRWDDSVEAAAVGEGGKPEMYRDADMLYEEDAESGPELWMYNKFEYGKKKEG